MKLGILSDTHDHIPNLQKAISEFNKQGVELVIHCGDWASPFMPYFTKGLKCKILSIFGNNEGDHFNFINREYPEEVEFHKEILVTQQAGKRLAVYHGTKQEITEALIACGEYDAVFTGHTHMPVVVSIGKTLHVNPGTLGFFRGGKLIDDPTIAVYNTETNTAEIILLR